MKIRPYLTKLWLSIDFENIPRKLTFLVTEPLFDSLQDKNIHFIQNTEPLIDFLI